MPAHLRTHWSARWPGGVLLVLLCAAFYLPGVFVLPPIDRDEARFAEASRQMAASDDWHDYIIPRIQGKPRLNKPPLIYWLQAGAADLVGAPTTVTDDRQAHPIVSPTGGAPLPPAKAGIWAYRLPSVLAALVTVLLTWRIGCRMFAPPVGLVAAVLIGCSAVVMLDARQARADQALLAFTTLAQWALFELWRGRHTSHSGFGWTLVFWLAVALGTLTKGPVTPVVALLTALALCVLTREWRWLQRLRPAIGVGVVVLIVTPWIVLVGQQLGWQRFLDTVIDETVGRSVSAREGHTGPPGYHLLLLPVLLWPGSLALVPGAWRAARRSFATTTARDGAMRRGWWTRVRDWWRLRRPARAAELFCLAWIVPSWLLFELVATKLPHYTLPMYPALALLCARALYGAWGWRWVFGTHSGRGLLIGWAVMTFVLAVVAPSALIVVGKLPPDPVLFTIIAAGMLAVVFLATALAVGLWRRNIRTVQWLAVTIAVIGHGVILQFIAPNLQHLWLSSRIVAAVHAQDPQRIRPLAAAGYHEDSLVFLTRGRVERLSWADLRGWVRQHPHGLLIVTEEAAFAKHEARVLAEVAGFNYSNGRWVRLRLVDPLVQ